MGVSFILLAKGAACDILLDEGCKARPPELGSDESSALEVARMSGGRMVMAALDKRAM